MGRKTRVACLLAPHLPVQMEKAHIPNLNGRPLVVGGRPWDPEAVLDCCQKAEEAGVYPGMELSRAEVLCPSAHFLPADEPAYRTAHKAVEESVRYYTDRVESLDLGLVLADVTGLERQFGAAPGDRAAGGRMGAGLAREARSATGLDVRAGLAGSRFTAEQAAHATRPGGWHAIPLGQERSFLSSLPLSVLPSESETLRRLNLLGIRTLGALAKLPRLALIRQFGPQAGFLHDLASGADPRPILSQAPPLALGGAWNFEPPAVDRGRIAAHATRIITAIAADISRQGYQVEGLRISLEDETGKTHSSATSVQPPTADSDRLARRLDSLLERLSPPHPIVDLSVTLYPLRPAHLGATQLSLFTGPTDGRRARLQEALRRLRQRFGEMIIVIGSLLGPPPPRPIQVTTDPVGLPRAVVWPDHILPVDRIYEHWRENRRWWSRPVLRDYYRAETSDGQVRVLFCERSNDRWWLERRYL